MSEYSGEMPDQDFEAEPTLESFNGLWTEGFESPRPVIGRSGNIFLGTEIGPRARQEDVLMLDTDHDAFAVIDGMGGYPDGDVAARIVAEEIQQRLPDQIPAAADQRKVVLAMQQAASERIRREVGRESGAAYVAGQIAGKKLWIWRAGDVQLFVLDRNGEIVFSHQDSMSLEQAPSGRGPGKVLTGVIPIENYYRIIAASDGLWNNIEQEGLFKSLANKKLETVVTTLATTAKRNMGGQMSNGNLGTGDNITILTYEILPSGLRGA